MTQSLELIAMARAIAVRRAGEEIAAVSEFQSGNLWNASLADARAALLAIREPTEAMREALSSTNLMWREMNSKLVWQTYVDHILSTPTNEARKG
jgi:hypothetical protein